MTGPLLGLVVNPVAGMGGRVGLHGTDAADLERARARGAEPVAPARAVRALARLAELAPGLRVLAAGGPMGAEHVPASLEVEELALRSSVSGATSPQDTADAVGAMVEAGVDLVLFAGGDGTARDVAAVVGGVPILGVPAGVKMHSGVFGTTPEAAGAAAGRCLASPAEHRLTRPAEVVDRDELGRVRLFATVSVPDVPAAVQARKGTASYAADDATWLGREVAEQMEPGRVYLLGPGTTVARVGEALGLPTTPLGVDVVLDGRLLVADAAEADLLAVLDGRPATLVLGVVGGQGFLLGRGNQQLSPAVLRAVGTENIVVLATPAKVAALEGPVLHVDIDDADLAARLAGHRRVRTGRARSTVLRVVA